MAVEEQALDSFGNLVFSVIRFWKRTGSWPEMITIVSHAFKEARFMELHVPAMRWPRDRVRFVGVDPEYMDEGKSEFDEDRAQSVRSGERERGFKEWERDPMGKEDRLWEKRRMRNFWMVGQLLFDGEEESEKSGVKSCILRSNEQVEESLIDKRQPWEEVIKG